jgi:hypothetical protein
MASQQVRIVRALCMAAGVGGRGGVVADDLCAGACIAWQHMRIRWKEARAHLWAVGMFRGFPAREGLG